MTQPKLKYLAFFDDGPLEFRLESTSHPLWRWRCASLDSAGVFPQWACWKERTLESGQQSAETMAEKLANSFPVELVWRDLSDLEDEDWERSMREKVPWLAGRRRCRFIREMIRSSLNLLA